MWQIKSTLCSRVKRGYDENEVLEATGITTRFEWGLSFGFGFHSINLQETNCWRISVQHVNMRHMSWFLVIFIKFYREDMVSYYDRTVSLHVQYICFKMIDKWISRDTAPLTYTLEYFNDAPAQFMMIGPFVHIISFVSTEVYNNVIRLYCLIEKFVITTLLCLWQRYLHKNWQLPQRWSLFKTSKLSPNQNDMGIKRIIFEMN